MRVVEDVVRHYEEVFEERIGEGLSAVDAHAAALDSLGDWFKAKSFYGRRFLTKNDLHYLRYLAGDEKYPHPDHPFQNADDDEEIKIQPLTVILVLLFLVIPVSGFAFVPHFGFMNFSIGFLVVSLILWTLNRYVIPLLSNYVAKPLTEWSIERRRNVIRTKGYIGLVRNRMIFLIGFLIAFALIDTLLGKFGDGNRDPSLGYVVVFPLCGWELWRLRRIQSKLGRQKSSDGDPSIG
ncbi:MAG: hypothetical protein H6751_05010 [Candidatus Omnitrophica bacterium]|nr:hypothetical protein [Candidatus Omnitrophota bacterium]